MVRLGLAICLSTFLLFNFLHGPPQSLQLVPHCLMIPTLSTASFINDVSWDPTSIALTLERLSTQLLLSSKSGQPPCCRRER